MIYKLCLVLLIFLKYSTTIAQFKKPNVFAILGGIDTTFPEYPHLGVLSYEKNTGRIVYGCGASLISNSFVLTAAHCVTGKILELYGKLSMVSFGDNDLSILNCQINNCPSHVHKFKICKVIPHEQFNENDLSHHHDIALIQLCDRINGTSHITPIRMPWTTNTSVVNSQEMYTVIGWGITLSGMRSKITQKLVIPKFDHDQCMKQYTLYGVNITNSHICAGGEFKEDTCDGDSGGPLEVKIDDTSYIVGIISFGLNCGVAYWPGIYTNVSAYKDWIIENMK